MASICVLMLTRHQAARHWPRVAHIKGQDLERRSSQGPLPHRLPSRPLLRALIAVWHLQHGRRQACRERDGEWKYNVLAGMRWGPKRYNDADAVAAGVELHSRLCGLTLRMHKCSSQVAAASSVMLASSA